MAQFRDHDPAAERPPECQPEGLLTDVEKGHGCVVEIPMVDQGAKADQRITIQFSSFRGAQTMQTASSP